MRNYFNLRLICIIVAIYITSSLKANEQPQWITATENQSATNTWLCFRKTIEIDSVYNNVFAKIAVDSKYWLWINGELIVFEGGVKRGPDPFNTYFDEINITSHLKKGKNLIEILVWYFGKQGFSYNPSGCAGLFVDIKDMEGHQVLKTDRSWLSKVHPAYETAGKPLPNFRLPESSIRYDAQKEDLNWNTDIEFKTQNNGWRVSSEKGEEGVAPWNKLLPRIIPQWKNYGYRNYVDTTLIHGIYYDTLICKLPYNAQITPYLSVNASEGNLITIFSDHYNGGGKINVRSEYITKNGNQEYESFGWMNGHNIYYVYPKNVTIKDVKYRETSYDTEFAGYFSSNDIFFNQLWNKARRTLLVTMRDTYMDCPDRERAQWWGDEVIESGEAFYALSPSSNLLMKKGMYELIGWQQEDGKLSSPIPASNYNSELPDQMLASIGYYGFWNYYLNTGDIKTIKDVYPGVKKYLNLWQFNQDSTIHLRKGDWTWGDWGNNIDKEVLYNAWYYLALKGAAKMAEIQGFNNDKVYFEQQMRNLKQAFNKTFWNGVCYRHPNYIGLTDDRANALAVVSGMSDKEKYPFLLNVLKTQEFASPYMEKYVIEALFIMGYGEYGLTRMKKRFATQVNDPNCTTLYEGWGANKPGEYYGGGTKNHAWSGGGLTILSQYVCGIEPLTPGYNNIRIKPNPAGIKNASATVSTVKGDIKVNFVDKIDVFELTLNTPLNTKSEVVIPFNPKKIKCNGKSIQAGKTLVLNGGEWKIIAFN